MDRKCDTDKTTDATLLPSRSAVIAAVAHSGLRGWRLSMEDEVVMELLSPQLGCFAVLDGHGGQFCSRWGARELPKRLLHVASQVETGVDETDEARYVAQQLSETVRQMDADLRGSGRPAWACGSTLVVLLATRRMLTVANLGDSRAVLCRAGSALPLSRDHKPKGTAERQRILQAGGFIIDGRVNGDLSLSRALGDFRHKCVPNLPPSKQPVSAEPEVRCTARLRTDHFVVIACDGVWDVMSSADAVAFVAGLLERVPAVDDMAPQTPDADLGLDAACERRRVAMGVICELLLDECLRRGSTDNISAVVVLLDPSLQPRSALIEAIPAGRTPPGPALSPCALNASPLLPLSPSLPSARAPVHCNGGQVHRTLGANGNTKASLPLSAGVASSDSSTGGSSSNGTHFNGYGECSSSNGSAAHMAHGSMPTKMVAAASSGLAPGSARSVRRAVLLAGLLLICLALIGTQMLDTSVASGAKQPARHHLLPVDARAAYREPASHLARGVPPPVRAADGDAAHAPEASGGVTARRRNEKGRDKRAQPVTKLL